VAVEAGGGALRRVVDHQALYRDIEVGAALVGVDEAARLPARDDVVMSELGQPPAAVDPDDEERIAGLDPVDLGAALGCAAIVGRVEVGRAGALRLRRRRRWYLRAPGREQRGAEQEAQGPAHSAFLAQPHVELHPHAEADGAAVRPLARADAELQALDVQLAFHRSQRWPTPAR
jgi:hypothetical protein